MISPYDYESMSKLTSDERVKVCQEYMRQPYAVEYAYSSSETARFYGMSSLGCWYVSAYKGVGKVRQRVYNCAFEHRAQAEESARVLRDEAVKVGK